ncbi:hypothetical protein [Hymenobacter cellulosivorans]|uniref:Uncharacterized protein n=1 Tax=Hymenobacter cellulosivorans TaxID=2932249 RepID=A0ABY4F5S4_9BACT|nr:hypothetical protein [Hymenobacter cellulosivorans]UOQ51269.1 hypothetical protein MUN80_16060 [Hymenobacter cellulosivorans]
MSIFGSDRPSGSMGGLLSGLFRTIGGGSPATGTSNPAARPAGMGRKLATGALLAAGAAYLYNRNKAKGVNPPGFLSGN